MMLLHLMGEHILIFSHSFNLLSCHPPPHTHTYRSELEAQEKNGHILPPPFQALSGEAEIRPAEVSLLSHTRANSYIVFYFLFLVGVTDADYPTGQLCPPLRGSGDGKELIPGQDEGSLATCLGGAATESWLSSDLAPNWVRLQPQAGSGEIPEGYRAQLVAKCPTGHGA